jgi:hypothetical protein
MSDRVRIVVEGVCDGLLQDIRWVYSSGEISFTTACPLFSLVFANVGVKIRLMDSDLTMVRLLVPAQLLLHPSFLVRLQRFTEESEPVTLATYAISHV